MVRGSRIAPLSAIFTEDLLSIASTAIDR
jgi:hypothetical protein